MIKTKQIKSISTKLPKSDETNIYVNVLTWHAASHFNGSKYHVFSPYYLKTDGQEAQSNKGNVLFENFWQGSKVWPIMYDTEIWAHRNLRGLDDKYLWFKYTCPNGMGSECHISDDGLIQPEYYKWREQIFACQHPIRYPNGFKRTSQVAFSLLKTENGTEERLDYISARKQIYIAEYCRLVRKLPEFDELKNFLKNGKTLILCEIDVPDNEIIDVPVLTKLVENKKIKFGHGLCLAWELLKNEEH